MNAVKQYEISLEALQGVQGKKKKKFSWRGKKEKETSDVNPVLDHRKIQDLGYAVHEKGKLVGDCQNEWKKVAATARHELDH